MRDWLNKNKIPVVFLLVFPITLATLLALFSIYKIPFSISYPDHYNAAKELLAEGRLKSYFTPVGYSGFIAMCLKLGGEVGIFWGQSVLYISTVILAFIYLRILGSTRLVSMLGSCALALHPHLFINIKRIEDNNLAVPLLLVFCIGTFYIEKNRKHYGFIAFWSCLLGLLVAVRANALSLLGIPFILFFVQDRSRIYRGILKLSIFLVTIFITLYSITTIIKGSPLFTTKKYAAYVFLTGTNEYTANNLLRDYNGLDGSVFATLKSKGISYDNKEIEAVYWKLSLKYISQHPLQYLYLCALKFITLFRPDYRQVTSPTTINSFYIKVIAQTLMATTFFLWLLALALTGINRIPARSWLVLPIVVLYILPFLITNADPRYRLPIEAVMLLDTVYRFSLIRSRIITHKLSGFKVST